VPQRIAACCGDALTGILFKLNPACGSGTLLWKSTRMQPSGMALLAAIPIIVLALVGAQAGVLGSEMHIGRHP